ncbi:response regulator transcription factor [Pseudaestuariivita atlantica]|uniref:Chemotaxis protein CheY n=1 Tax=Pseudaestuariivita atlantica TaxID=1317121 RepID=A0A0L1JTC0_9RHOB|nr:response regulator [Pseudaestuariivita atlantica]KNG95006.1 chemotaxis protein CheY [Pseudaestuariivita atlantica]
MSRHVLVIEDEQNITAAISFILSRDGWDVSTHANGVDAVDTVRTRAPDVLILDAMLPGRSGYDILRDLRADPGMADLPVLMLTARGQAKDRARALEAGATQFMTKPFANGDVVDAVRVLGGV